MENYQNQNNYQDQGYNQGNNNFMVTKLPNTTISMVLGIVSIICCCSVIVGIVCSIIGLVLSKNDMKLYNSNPNQYTGIENANTARILNIIGLVLSIGYLIYSIYTIYAFGGWDAYMQYVQETIKMAQAGQMN